MRVILLAAFLVGLTAPALAEFKTGNDIYGKCLSSEGTGRLYCLAYITGSFDQLGGSEEYECVDIEKVSAGQIRDVVIAYLRKTPESRHFSAASLVRNAIYYAFCK